MADQARLLAVIEANTKQFENALKRIERATDQSFRRTGRRMDTVFANSARNLTRQLLAPLAAFASARGIQQAVDSYTRIENALKVAGLQGAEMEAVFARLFASAQKNAAPLEALVELYGRAALVQKELGITSEELLRFTDGVSAALRVSGKTAAESSGALLQLAQALGSGVVRAEEFNSILEGALPVAQAAARGLEEAGGSVARLRQLVIDGRVSSEAFFRAFTAGQGSLEDLAATTDITIGGAFTRLNNTFTAAVGKLNEASTASKVLGDAMDTLGGAITTVANALAALDSGGQIGNLVREFNRLDNAVTSFAGALVSGDIQRAGEIARGWRESSAEAEDAAGTIERAKELVRSTPPIAGDDVIADPVVDPKVADDAEATARRIAIAFDAIGQEAVKPVSLNDFAPPAARGGGAGAGRNPAIRAAEREAEAVADLIAELERELSLIGQSDTAQRISAELRQAGAAATEEQRAKIAELVTTIAEQEAAFGRLVDSMDEMRFTGLDALSAFNDSLRQGEGLAGGLKSALDRVLDTIIRIAEQQAISALFGATGTPGGGIFGSILGGIFGGAVTAPAITTPSAARIPTAPAVSTIRLPAAAAAAPVQIQITTRNEPSPLFVSTVDARVTAGNARVMRQMPGVLADQRARRLIA